ncbi:MAG: beta-lactamase family protein, partial [Gammaproteobacteria bacterium]|nr:beta-lactamase family protein [Gammaproteobacteria bacterium]
MAEVAEIDALMRPYQGKVPGASVLVVRRGEQVLRRAYGQADLESDVPATPLTNYRLASLTKQFTAAAIALLVEARRLGFDDLAGRWLPELPASAGAIRLRHLLTHTSGLIDYEDLIPAGTEVALRDADVLGLLAAEPRLYFAPGTGFRYSNGAYALLALIVERAAGIDFASFLRERIFA